GRGGRERVVEVPIAMDLYAARAGDQVVARWQRAHTLVQRVRRLSARGHGIEQALAAPPGGHAGGEQRLHLGGEVQRTLVPGVEEGLDAEPVARGKEPLLGVVPQDEGVLTTEAMEALRPEVFIQVERDLAVGAR